MNEQSRRILLIYGHPVKDSFSDEIRKYYLQGAGTSGAEIRELFLREMHFDLNFHEGYRGNQELEDVLKKSQQDILWAHHLVFIYPNWWATFPALLKGFIDRTFLPGFAFKYAKGIKLPEKLLKGRTARLIVTMDSPKWYYKYYVKQPGHNAMRKGVLNFCGIRPVKINTLGPVKTASGHKKNQWLKKMEALGRKDGAAVKS